MSDEEKKTSPKESDEKKPEAQKKELVKAPDKSPEEEGVDSANDVMKKFLENSED